MLITTLLLTFLVVEGNQNLRSQAIVNTKAENKSIKEDTKQDDTEDGLTSTGKIPEVSIEDTIRSKRKNLPERAEIELKEMLQLPELPTGCESVSMTMVLNFYGYHLDKTDFVEDYLIYDLENMADGYAGDPYSEFGAGIFPPGLTKSANAFLKKKYADISAKDITGTAFRSLLPYIASDVPVVVWTTSDYEKPMFEEMYYGDENDDYEWYMNEHCVVLAGYDLKKDTITLYDPLEGEISMDADEFKEIYDEIGQYAVVVY